MGATTTATTAARIADMGRIVTGGLPSTYLRSGSPGVKSTRLSSRRSESCSVADPRFGKMWQRALLGLNLCVDQLHSLKA